VNTDLGQADQVLTYDQPILSSATVPPQFETALSEQTGILNNALTTLNHAEALQGPAGAAQELYSGADELFRYARPMVLVDQGGHWLITHDSAMTEMYWFWQAAERSMGGVVP
jgi:hypothetical protein